MSALPVALAQTLRQRIGPRGISFSFTRSGGPGGQNVNKVNTRVTLFFDLRGSPHLTDEEKSRIAHHHARRISQDGVLQVVSSRFRTQAANREAAVERLFELLAQALQPRKSRRPTKPSKAASKRRLQEKKRAGDRKRLRSRVEGD